MTADRTRLVPGIGVLALIVLLLAGCGGTTPPSASLSSGDSTPAASAAPDRSPSSPAVDQDPAAAALRGAWRPAPYPLRQPLPEVDGVVDRCRQADGEIGDVPPQVIDVRGDGRALIVFAEAEAEPDAAWACLGDAIGGGAPEVFALAVPADPIGDEKLDLSLYERVTHPDGAVTTVAVGRVGRAGNRVVAAFDDESEVEAAKGGGWWSMWWPTTVDAATVAVLNRQSLAIDAIPMPR